MEIQTIDVKRYTTGRQTFTEDGFFVKKSLPVLSIVQAVEGSYQISLDDGPAFSTGEMGAFIAPSEKLQSITHHVNPQTGRMRAHWVFLDVVVNGVYPLDGLYAFPVLLPHHDQQQVYSLISRLLSGRELCDDLSDLYRLIKILLNCGTQRPKADPMMNEIISFVGANYMKKLTVQDIGMHLSLSPPSVFRKFQAFFGKSPANFINDVRLSQAAILLETTNHSVAVVSREAGFEDAFYFSRLFRAKYGVSPSYYRSRLRREDSNASHS